MFDDMMLPCRQPGLVLDTAPSIRTRHLVAATIMAVFFLLRMEATAHFLGPMEFVCPICQTSFMATIHPDGTQTGKRLDLKPVGLIPPVLSMFPVCPKCGFVVFKIEFKAEEKENILKMISSDEYKRWAVQSPPHYLLGHLYECLHQNSFDIAICFLQASWQMEEDAKVYRECLLKARHHFNLCMGDPASKTTLAEIVTTRVLYGEILRQLGDIAEAEQYFRDLQPNPQYQAQPYPAIIEYELQLLSDKDAQPHFMPGFVPTEAGPADRADAVYRALNGCERLSDRFDIQKLSLVKVHEIPLLYADLKTKSWQTVNRIEWFNPTDAGKPRCDADNLLEVYDEIENAVAEHGWIKEWRNAGSNRTVEVQVFGMIPHTSLNFDYLAKWPWKHAHLQGEPWFELQFLRDGSRCAMAFLGTKEKKALIVIALPGKGEHWLDRALISIMPDYETPEYLLVDRKGRRRKVRLDFKKEQPPAMNAATGQKKLMEKLDQELRKRNKKPEENLKGEPTR